MKKNEDKIVLTSKSRVLFATFSPWVGGIRMPTNGSLEPLRDFLLPRIFELVLIDQPFPGSDFVLPRIEIYRNRKMTMGKNSFWMSLLSPFLLAQNTSGTRVSFKVRDFFSVLDQGIRNKGQFDFFIGLESINTLAGIILKRFGKVKRVVYYVSDYAPDRFGKGIFNRIYLLLDRICAHHADYIWDVSKAMQPARISAGLHPDRSAPVIYVPNGLLPEQIQFEKNNSASYGRLAYMGTLGEENGPDLAIECLPKIETSVPNVHLVVIGGYPSDISRLTILAKKLHVEERVTFHGFVQSPLEMSKILRSCYLAVAPYRAFPGSVRYFADAGKIRAYCAAGLPVITTPVPPLGKVVAHLGGAVIAADTVSNFSTAIIEVLTDKKLYASLRKGAIQFAKDSTWDHTFAEAFRQMTVVRRR